MLQKLLFFLRSCWLTNKIIESYRVLCDLFPLHTFSPLFLAGCINTFVAINIGPEMTHFLTKVHSFVLCSLLILTTVYGTSVITVTSRTVLLPLTLASSPLPPHHSRLLVFLLSLLCVYDGTCHFVRSIWPDMQPCRLASLA